MKWTFFQGFRFGSTGALVTPTHNISTLPYSSHDSFRVLIIIAIWVTDIPIAINSDLPSHL